MSEPEISLNQAVEILKRLQGAAPATTGAKLAQVMALLQTLAAENAYLQSLAMEQSVAASAVEDDGYFQPIVEPAYAMDMPQAEDTPSVGAAPVEAVASDTIFKGLNDALRPPLVAIRGRAELVQGGLLGQITSEQDTWLQAIQENTNRAFAVLDAVQEMMALREGKVRIEPVNFLSTDLLTEAWERMRDRAREFNQDVTIQAPDIVPLARADFYQSLIVLTDLLDNAIRYTPPGGKIRMSVDNLGTHVLLSVADSGIGLTESDLEHIGQPFWRGTQQRLVRAHTGTGLRLHLARAVLALQDGELIYSGEPGVGSTFSFTLPIPE